MRCAQTFAGVTALAVATASTAAGREPLQPTSAWRVDYTGSQCVAMRNYGTAAKPEALLLKPSPVGSIMGLLWLEGGSGAAYQTEEIVRWGPGPERRMSVFTYGNPVLKMRITTTNIPIDDFRKELDAPELSLSGVAATARLALSGMRSVADQLDTCLLRLQQDWRVITLNADGGTPPRAVQPISSLFRSEDYPTIATWQNQEGRVQLNFLVDETGAVRDCSVDSTSGVPVLDTMSCYVIQKRAKFTPARAPDGKPRKSTDIQAIFWKLEN